MLGNSLSLSLLFDLVRRRKAREGRNTERGKLFPPSLSLMLTGCCKNRQWNFYIVNFDKVVNFEMVNFN